MVGGGKGVGTGGRGRDGQPRYVTAIDAETGTVRVGSAEDLDVWTLTGVRPVFTSGVPFEAPVECEGQVRARGEPVPAVAEFADGGVSVRLRSALRGVAPGQTLVLYR